MPRSLEIFGRVHPLVLHLPIGFLFACLVLEILRASGRVSRGTANLFLWLAALTAIVSASSGWVLGHEDGYGGETLELHEIGGISVAVLTTLAAACALRAERSAVLATLSRVFLGSAIVVLLPTGHLGSTLTHGRDWLAGPVHAPAPAETPLTSPLEGETDAGPAHAEPSTYETAVAPIFAARCGACHGATKKKGGLRLTSAADVQAGGEDGPVVVPGDPAASAILVRTRLPLEHEDHMPPDGKPQPSAEELAVLEAWVRAGAPFVGRVELGVPVPAPVPPAGTSPAPDGEKPASEPKTGALPDPQALEALAAALVHVQPVAADAAHRSLLWIDFAAVAPTTDDAAVTRLLTPLRAHVADLSLARSAITDAALELVASCPGLERLDLRATSIGDAGLAALAGHATLAELVLAQTRVTDAAVETLLALPALRRVFLWKTGLSEAALARLRAERPALDVVGDEPPEAALESEGELAFTSDRPLPEGTGAPAPAATPSLAPVNTTCPVSGDPVKPGFAVVHEGRVIGFCCAKCPSVFLENPAAYAAKLP